MEEQQTKYLLINPDDPEKAKISLAAKAIRAGELVAFPTETVYGLGANALNREAVKKIFQAKGRPPKNPLIVHIAGLDQVPDLVASWPEIAASLAAKFWPGPLTLVLSKSPVIPEEVTAGLPSVALRFPANKVASALIRSSGVPIAAPSANLSGRPSPTTAAHVWQDLQGKIAVLLDGGPTGVGVESTILDLSSKTPVLLRPGGIDRKELENLLGELQDSMAASCPGMGLRHYLPRAKVVMLTGKPEEQVEKVKKYLLENSSYKVGVLATLETEVFYLGIKKQLAFFKVLGSRINIREIARSFFSALREGEQQDLDVLLVETIPSAGIGLAVMNRLKQAAEGRFI